MSHPDINQAVRQQQSTRYPYSSKIQSQNSMKTLLIFTYIYRHSYFYTIHITDIDLFLQTFKALVMRCR